MPIMSWNRGSMARPILGACRGVLIYLAGPLFSEAERRFNLRLTQRLEALGFEVFLPQRAGVERDRPPYDDPRGAAPRHVPPRQDQDPRRSPDSSLRSAVTA
jgi:hypothetical protein